MSVAGSCRSTRSVATVAGGNHTRRNRCSSSSVKDEGANDKKKRQVCKTFEVELGLDKYRRNRQEQERDVDIIGIRINSQHLKASYDVPAEHVYDLLQRLHSLLAPGFRGVNQGRGRYVESVEASQEQEVYKNWHSKTDFTVQLKPKVPSVLWMDIDCEACKRRMDHEEHLHTRKILPTIIKALLKSLKDEDVKLLSNPFYVSRGITCGVHLFFPDIIIPSEYEMLSLWNEVDKELKREHQNVAGVDTGCSSIPLPCSRHHSGLNRLKYIKKINSNNQDDIQIITKSLDNPALQDLAKFTNFYHLVAGLFDNESSDSRSECIKKADHKHTTGVPGDCRESTNTKGILLPASEDSFVKGGLRDPQPLSKYDKGFTSIQTDSDVFEQMDGVDSDVHAELGNVECDVNVSVESINARVVRSTPSPPPELVCDHNVDENGDEPLTVTNFNVNNDNGLKEPGVCIASETITTGCTVDGTVLGHTPSSESTLQPMDITMENADQLTEAITIDSDDEGDDERAPKSQHSSASVSSSSSSSGKRQLIQADIRSMYGNYKRKRSSDSSASEPSSKSCKVSVLADSGALTRRGLRSDDCDSSIIGGVPPSTTSSMQSIRGGVQPSTHSSMLSIDGEPPSSSESSSRTRRCHTLTDQDVLSVTSSANHMTSTEMTSAQSPSSRVDGIPAVPTSPYAGLRELYVSDDTVPNNARLPHIGLTAARNTNDSRSDRVTKETFLREMSMNLGHGQNRVHVTDIELLVNGFNTEYDFYNDMIEGSTDLNGSGLRIKTGGSLNARRENCPAAYFPHYIPHVLYSEDFLSETVWTSVLARYYDEYLNNATFLYIMSNVLQRDDRVNKNLSEESRSGIKRSVDKCLKRFQCDMVGFQRTLDQDNGYNISAVPKQPYTDKCKVVIGLIAISSLAFRIVTPMFTDLAKVCRMLSHNNKQTLDTLNASCMSDTNEDDGSPYDAGSLSQAQSDESEDESFNDGGTEETIISASLNNSHSVLASILRWNYDFLHHDTLWGLFYYYHYVHTDGLGRILNEVVHGGVMVTAMLQAYFESCRTGQTVGISQVCRTANEIFRVLADPDSDQEEGDRDRAMMPPPTARGRGRQPQQRQRATSRRPTTGRAANQPPTVKHKVRFNDVLEMMFRRYLRPTSFGDEGLVVYTEKGYEKVVAKKDYYSCFTRSDKDKRQVADDLFGKSTKKYSMSHGDLLMYFTDMPSPVNENCSCTYNLVLNVFENMHGGCMTFLRRHFKENLQLFCRFHCDAYRLVVECRHAMNELIQSIELSYMNLILRQPIVPPLLETDVAVRHMFLSSAEVQNGAFVCLNAMDYERAINMFTKQSRVPKENCKTVESFLDRLISGHTDDTDVDDDARTRFRTIYLFFLLYQFEVLYKIRHVYNSDQMSEVSIEGMSRDLDVSGMLRLFFGECELQLPRGLSPEIVQTIGMSNEVYTTLSAQWNNTFNDSGNNTATNTRCVNTRPVVCTALPNKLARMKELFGRKGLSLIKSYGPLPGSSTSNDTTRCDNPTTRPANAAAATISSSLIDDVVGVEEISSDRDENSNGGGGTPSYVGQDRAFLALTPTELIDSLFKSSEWYENCDIRMKATCARNKNKPPPTRVPLDHQHLMTFCESILLVIIKTGRLNHIEVAVREEKKEFGFCTEMPLRCKMIAFVMAVHSSKRLTQNVADVFVRKEFRSGRIGMMSRTSANKNVNQMSRDPQNDMAIDQPIGEEVEPDVEWFNAWSRLLSQRRSLLLYCRELAVSDFPDNYFVGLHPEKTYGALFKYMVSKGVRYETFHRLKMKSWAVQVCTAINYLLVMNAYDPELVEFCLQLFLSFEWPGQWAKRIFVWKSNSNAGKSLFLEHVISKAFFQSTSINDPKGGKENAPEKSEYHKNFLLMINEFSSAVTSELKKLCSTSGYTYRMNFSNEMIHSFMVGKLVFNCNTLPMTTDHATIQRVALIPLPFWFEKRQTVVDAMMNWTRNHSSGSDYDVGVRRNIVKLMTAVEKDVFKNDAKKDFEDFNEPPNENTRGMFSEKVLSDISEQSVRSAMFLVQNKTSQVYLWSELPLTDIVAGIVTITKYFCRFRFLNTIKEPVNFSKLPTACKYAMKEWQMVSQPYFDWKACCKVCKDPMRTTKTKVSVIHASLQKFAKAYIRNTSFFDLRQFFECDFSEERIPGEGVKEDEYYVVLEDLAD